MEPDGQSVYCLSTYGLCHHVFYLKDVKTSLVILRISGLILYGPYLRALRILSHPHETGFSANQLQYPTLAVGSLSQQSPFRYNRKVWESVFCGTGVMARKSNPSDQIRYFPPVFFVQGMPAPVIKSFAARPRRLCSPRGFRGCRMPFNSSLCYFRVLSMPQGLWKHYVSLASFAAWTGSTVRSQKEADNHT